jgi:tripartite-type tricarboxylate transporter receptor subunit TctC
VPGRSHALAAWFCALLAIAAGFPAAAQPWPARPLRLVVAFPPGGTNDIVARSVAQRLTERLGHPVVVENRPGANGAIGAEAAAKAPADGYTLFVAAVNHVVLPSLYPKLPYDIERDFTPVVLLATVPIVVTLHPSVPASSIAELISLAKAKPGALNYASSGNGAGTHLAGELFKMQAGVSLTHVPYKGSGPAMSDLVGGQVQLMFADLPSVSAQIKAGRLKVLAVGSPRPSRLVPDLPTVSASGLPGYEAYTWVGILAPTGTPRDIVVRLNAEATAALERQDLKDALAAQGAEAAPGSPEQFGNHLRDELAKWARVVRTAGIRAD